ncbi:MAG: outer membrane beta-barrel protein [Prolixibacteraceae bacterium]|nr:outer membrane beta-barrel protein [Prolixibacteraceae bacterium]
MDIQNSHGKKSIFVRYSYKFIVAIALLFFAFEGFSQVDFSLGISAGYDKSYNQFYKMPKTNVDGFPDYNFGVDAILGINDWLRVKAEIHYANLGFTRHWNIESTNPDRIDLSKVSLNNLDISPKVDLRFLKIGNFEAYATAGFKFEFLLGKYEVSYTASGEEMEGDYVADEYNEGQAGLTGGLLFKYKASDKISITLSPEYTYFFDPLYKLSEYEDDYKYDLYRVGVKLGVEWRF